MDDASTFDATDKVRIHRTPPVPIWRLRLWRPRADVLRRLSLDAAVPWPVIVNSTTPTSSGEIICSAPDCWLVMGDLAAQAPGRLIAALEGQLHHWSDLTHGLATYAVEGRKADDVVARGCPIPPAELKPGRSAQTRFAGVPALLRRGPSDSVLITLDAALADYAVAWLARAQQAVEVRP